MPLDIHVRAAARAGLGKEEEVHQLAEEQFQRQVTLVTTVHYCLSTR
jgi:hypothetical protein